MSKWSRIDARQSVQGPHAAATEEELQRLQTGLAGTEADLQDVARFVATSPGLTNLLLRHVNGARLGLAQRVHSVQHAVALLGTRQLSILAEEWRTRVEH